MLDSYYASYPLEYYELGTAYSFYARKTTKYKPANPDNIEKFSVALNVVEEDNDSYPYSKFSSYCIRICGVVVEKIKGNNVGHKDRIRVMFQNVDENGVIEYVENLYVVNYAGVETDGWEAMTVQTAIQEAIIDGTFAKPVKIGTTGATIDDIIKVTGVTIDEGKSAAEKNVYNKPSVKLQGKTGVTLDDVTGVTLDDTTGVTLDED